MSDLAAVSSTFSASQQLQIIEAITARGPQPALTSLGHLTLSRDEVPAPPKIPVPEELERLEDRIVERIVPLLPPDVTPRVLLFGPNVSKTDPLYALRLLLKLGIKTDRPGELMVYDLYDNPLLRPYYKAVPWGGHRVSLNFGPAHNFARLQEAKAHVILSIHPGLGFDELFASFAENLVKGGVAVVQSSVWGGVVEEGEYENFLKSVMALYGKPFRFLCPVLRSRLFSSFFSERSSTVHALALQKQ